jgi:hypothetical protein
MEQVVQLLRDQAWIAIGSIATALAFVVAFVAIVLDLRDRAAAERQRQASRISAWISNAPGREVPISGPWPTIAEILNASDQPVYRVIVWMVFYAGGLYTTGEDAARDDERGPATALVLPPGRYRVRLPVFDPGMLKRPAVEIAFTDASGRHWIRRQDGRLDPIESAAPVHYGLSEPLDWGQAEPVPDPRR